MYAAEKNHATAFMQTRSELDQLQGKYAELQQVNIAAEAQKMKYFDQTQGSATLFLDRI